MPRGGGGGSCPLRQLRPVQAGQHLDTHTPEVGQGSVVQVCPAEVLRRVGIEADDGPDGIPGGDLPESGAGVAQFVALLDVGVVLDAQQVVFQRDIQRRGDLAQVPAGGGAVVVKAVIGVAEQVRMGQV